MNNKGDEKLSSEFDFFANLFQTTLDREGKYLIDQYGVLLLSNNEKINLPVEEENLLSYLSSFILEFGLSDLQTEKRFNQSYTTRFEIRSNANDIRFFQLLMIPFNLKNQIVYYLQIIDETKYHELHQRLTKQLQKMEHEILLRTNEIVHTSELMEDHGGFFVNFFRGLRHDLKSPISQLKEIINYYKTAKDPKKKQQAAKLIDSCLENLSNTSNNFSDFVDLHFLTEYVNETCHFDPIFKEVTTMLESEIDESKAEISVNFMEESVEFGKKQLVSIFYNLLSNAIKFRSISRPLKIDIFTIKEENEIILSITDNGLGIDLKKDGHKLFQPFKPLNNHTKGMGVGLSMVHNLLLKNQSSIKVKSELDKGTTMIVSFQVSDPVIVKTDAEVVS